MPTLTLPIGEIDDSCTLVPEDQPAVWVEGDLDGLAIVPVMMAAVVIALAGVGSGKAKSSTSTAASSAVARSGTSCGARILPREK